MLLGGEGSMAGDSAGEGALGSRSHHICFSEAESREK